MKSLLEILLCPENFVVVLGIKVDSFFLEDVLGDQGCRRFVSLQTFQRKLLDKSDSHISLPD
jgi:hypothetical protein